jgi:hypothetical protein
MFKLLNDYIMFLTIVDTKTYGKFVLYKYPYSQFTLPKENISSIDMIDFLTKSFDYCKDYLIKLGFIKKVSCYLLRMDIYHKKRLLIYAQQIKNTLN